ncbi:MAG: hypothetical protein GX597_21230 [Anaerolineaceae bacterium]|nr:hypothetical protein [Anaerolineaceae bacterium]
MVKRYFRLWLPLLLIILPLVFQVVYLGSFAVDLPWSDQWLVVPVFRALTSGKPDRFLNALWHQHNEHRFPLPRLFFFLLARVTDWNVVVEMWCSVGVAVLTLAGWWLIYRKTVGTSSWGFVPIAWLVFSLGQWENILFGMQFCFYLQVFGTVFALYFLSLKSWKSAIAAILCALVASLSLNVGLLVWPAGVFLLLASRARNRPRLAAWTLVGIATFAAYFTGYQFPQEHPPLTSGLFSPITTARFFLMNVGASLGGGVKDLSLAMGVCLLVVMGLFLYSRIRRRPRLHLVWSSSDVLGATFILLSLFTSAVITIARVGFGHIDWAVSSRYTTLTALGIIGIYMLLLKDNLPGAAQGSESGRWLPIRLFPALLAILFVGLAAANSHGVAMGKVEREKRLELRLVLQTFERQSDETLKRLLLWDGIRQEAAFLRAVGWSVFRQPTAQRLNMIQDRGGPRSPQSASAALLARLAQAEAQGAQPERATAAGRPPTGQPGRAYPPKNVEACLPLPRSAGAGGQPRQPMALGNAPGPLALVLNL